MTHSAGGPFGLLVAEARPNLVRATIIIEGAGGSAFGFGSRWGLSTIPVTYDPPVSDPAEIKTKWVARSGAGRCRVLPTGRARAEAAESQEHEGADRDSRFVICVARQSRRGGVPQAGGCARRGIALGRARHERQRPRHDDGEEQPSGASAADRLDAQERDRQQQSGAQRHGAGNDSLALKLADAGMFWVGTSNTKKMPYGTIHEAPMFVQSSSPPNRAIRCRSCSCTVAAARWCTTSASVACRGGRIISSRLATRCIWSIRPGTVDRSTIPTLLARSVRWSPTTCSRAIR